VRGYENIVFLFTCFLLIGISLNTFVNGEGYPLPGSDYNNVGVKAGVMIDLNVTLINTAQ